MLRARALAVTLAVALAGITVPLSASADPVPPQKTYFDLQAHRDRLEVPGHRARLPR